MAIEEAPFRINEKVVCINKSADMSINGDLIGFAVCLIGRKYTVNNCIWSSRAGWLVEITGEFHKASDFRKAGEE